MNPEQREGVYENAQYLREVRPIDPAEIHEYVEGQPHPAAVRQVLREAASALGLLEREDGTFVPASEEPINPLEGDAGPVETLPEPYVRGLEDRLLERYGPNWPNSTAGDRLRERIRRFKRAYFAGDPVEYDEETALAYAIYHLPDYYAATRYVLRDLARDGLLGKRLRVLDVGAGVGGPTLGLFDLLPDDALCAYHAVEPSPAADLLEGFASDAGRNTHLTVHRERAEAFDPEGEYDLILFVNVLSELDDPVAVVGRYLDHLAPDGTSLLLAPADRETAIGLREVERVLTRNGDATVYAPTIRLWPGEFPSDRCWSFDVKPDLDVPPFQRRLDDAAADPEHESGEFVNADVQYAYSLLRRDGKRAIEFTPDERRVAKLANSETHVSERVNAVAIKLSHSLSAEGNPLFLVGDGSQDVDHYAVLTRETAVNRDLRDAAYGDLLAFENVLVLWNEDEGSYNFVVDDETVVDAIAV